MINQQIKNKSLAGFLIKTPKKEILKNLRDEKDRLFDSLGNHFKKLDKAVVVK